MVETITFSTELPRDGTEVAVLAITTLLSTTSLTSLVRSRKIMKSKRKKNPLKYCPGFIVASIILKVWTWVQTWKTALPIKQKKGVERIRHCQVGKGRLSSGWLLAQWDWEPYLIPWPLAARLAHLLHARFPFFPPLGLSEINWTELPDVQLWCQSKPSCR